MRNRLPVQGTYGGDSVLLELSHYLGTHGCSVEFAALSRSHGFAPWFKLAPELRELHAVRAPSNFRYKNFLVRTSLDAWSPASAAGLARRVPAVLGPLARWLHVLARRPRRDPEKGFSATPTAEDLAYVTRLAEAFRPDALIVDYAWLTPLFAALNGAGDGVKKIVLGHESLHIRAGRFKRQGLQPDLFDWDLATEVKQLAGADVLLLETNEEASVMQAALPGVKVVCTPRGMAFVERTGARVRGRCLFVGSDAPANVIGLRWFLESVWPLVLALNSEAHLEVCGSVCRLFRKDSPPRVSFRGKVPSLDPHYGAAAVCLLPLTVGTGLKTKLVEALCHGCACVATPTGAAGAEPLIGTAVLAESEARPFAEALVRVLRDDTLRESMEAAATAYAKEFLTPDATFRPLLDLLRN